MKFIGGPMHGLDVPEPLLHVMPDFVNIERMNEDGSVTIMIYIRQQWFVGIGKPPILFYGMYGQDIDQLIEMGRKVLTPC